MVPLNPRHRLGPVLAVLATGALLVFGQPFSARAFRNVQEGTEAPDFTLVSTDGQEFTLSSLRGRVVTLTFVKLGQEKSEQTVEALAALGPEFEGKAVPLAVVINPEEGDPASLSSRAGERVPVLLDEAGKVYGMYGVLVTPSTGIIGAEGLFRGERAGYTAAFLDDLTRDLKIALGLISESEAATQVEESAGADKSDARKSSERQLEKSKLLLKRKMHDKAIDAAREAVAEDDSYDEAHVVLANLLLDASEDNADEAARHFEKALAISPRNGEAKIGQARIMSIRGEYDEAASILQKAVLVTPKPERLYYELGLVYERAGKYEEAVKAYRAALEKILF